MKGGNFLKIRIEKENGHFNATNQANFYHIERCKKFLHEKDLNNLQRTTWNFSADLFPCNQLI